MLRHSRHEDEGRYQHHPAAYPEQPGKNHPARGGIGGTGSPAKAQSTVNNNEPANGGGIGGTGNICGALVGAASVIGTLYSRSSLEEKENPRMWAATKAVMKNFDELAAPHGGINCCQIARVDWMDRDQVKDFYSNPDSRRQHCLNVVGETAMALGQLLEQEAERSAVKSIVMASNAI